MLTSHLALVKHQLVGPKGATAMAEHLSYRTLRLQCQQNIIFKSQPSGSDSSKLKI